MHRLRSFVIAAAIAASGHAFGQSSPGLVHGQVPTAGQWNSYFSDKQDYLGARPCLETGCVFSGPIITAASSTINAGLRITPGVAPTPPTNGDIWTTSAGVYVRINGATVGPLTGPSAGSFAATSPITVSFPSSVVTYAFDFSVANTWTGTQTFENQDIRLLGSSTGYTIFTSANAGASNYVMTFPANSGTVAQLNLAQTWTADQSFGVVSATSAALGGCTIGGSVLCTTGTSEFGGLVTVTSSSSSAFAVGRTGTTDSAFKVDASVGSAATGVLITGRAAAAGASISAISSAVNEGLTIDAKGSGLITLGGTSTGNVVLTRRTSFSQEAVLSGILGPAADSTTAIRVTRADLSTAIITVDSTNSRVGINKTPGAFDLDANGAVNVGGVLTFGTLSAASLSSSTSTITGLTINNSPSAANDYLLYYSAADGAIRRCTIGACSSAGASGVSSLNALTGALTVAAGAGISVTTSTPNITVALSSARQTLPTVSKCTTPGTGCSNGGFGGAGTYTTPANVLWIEIYMWGAGGGGGGAAGGTVAAASGGGGGAFIYHVINSPAATYTYAVGAAGAGGAAGANNGSAGGNTCWNTSGAACTSPVYQANGGAGGVGQTTITAGCSVSGSPGGGTAGSGTPVRAVQGGPGQFGCAQSGVMAVGGNGGNAPNGGGGGAGSNVTSGAVGAAPGGGGSGAGAGGSSVAGSNGADGAIIVIEHYGS